MNRNIAVLIVILIAAGASARPKPDSAGQKGAAPMADYCFQRYSDTISNLWLAHSNRMAIGRPFRFTFPNLDDQEQIDSLPYPFAASFPGGSGQEYLYGAALWVGGIKGQDTMVSLAFDFDAPRICELIPQPCPTGAFQNPIGLADREHRARATDTIIATDTLYRCDIGDCNDWYPMNIEVTSHSRTWVSDPFNQSVIVEYCVKNIDSLPLSEGWVGIYADCDISDPFGDISGFIPGVIDSLGQWIDLNLAYCVDMDGDPINNAFDSRSVTGAFGIQVLDLSIPDWRVNFNWWVPGFVSGSDWGPRQTLSAIRDLGGSYAEPHGDSNKYFVMSNSEIDYNQIEAGLLHSGWANPTEDAVDLAFGGDTRFLISVGPFDLAPADSVVFTVAYVAGRNVINNPFITAWFQPGNPLSVSDYYELLRLTDLEKSALAALAAYRSGYRLPPPGPPEKFTLADYDDTYADLQWKQKTGTDLAGYRLWQKIDIGQWGALADFDITDTGTVINDLQPDRQYRFAMTSFDSSGSLGAMTPEIVLRPNRPHPPDSLTGSAPSAYPELRWQPSRDADIIRYRIYRREVSRPDTIIAGETADTIWYDLSTSTALTYEYFVTALSPGLESEPSASIRLTPLLLTSGILVYNANYAVPVSNLIFRKYFFDSLVTRGLDSINYAYHDIDDDGPLTLSKLSHYSLLIASSENRSGALNPDLDAVLPDYLSGGGKAILILRMAAFDTDPVPQPQKIRFNQSSIFSRYFSIDSSYLGPLTILPGPILAGDLIGATPTLLNLPHLEWDSIKVNQFSYQVPGGLPFVGYFWPRPPAEPLYLYQSRVPDSSTHGQVTAVRINEPGRLLYLVNLPLSEMKLDSAAAFLRWMVFDLNEQFICGDINRDYKINMGDLVAYLQYLYKGYQPPAIYEAGDVNCDGQYSLADLLILLNYYLVKGVAPDCCQ